VADAYAELNAYWETPFAVCPDDEPRQLRELVRYATLAPNAHNTQAWQFALGPGLVRIFPDYSRSMPVGDPGDRELWISIGCALETLLVAARRVGYEPAVEHFPADEPEECLRVRFTPGEPADGDPLFAAIPLRHSNRRPYDGKPIPATDLEAIDGAVSDPGVGARILVQPGDFEQVIAVVRSGFAWQRSSKDFRRELRSWIRFSRRSTVASRDGLATRAVGRPQLPDPLGRFILRMIGRTRVEEKEIVGKIRSSSALLVLTTEANDRVAWVRAGQSLARLKLQATALGVRCAHLNNNWQWEATKAPAQERLELGERHPQVAIRLGYAVPLPHAPRRPLDEVLRPE
jgi:nitroreductase